MISRRAVPWPGSLHRLLFGGGCGASHTEGGWPAEGFKHLSHPSVRIEQHTLVARHIERHLDELRGRLRARLDDATVIFVDAYRELQRTLPDPPPLADLAAPILDAIRQAQVFRVNMDSDLELRSTRDLSGWRQHPWARLDHRRLARHLLRARSPDLANGYGLAARADVRLSNGADAIYARVSSSQAGHSVQGHP